jgi:hypothetical protein
LASEGHAEARDGLVRAAAHLESEGHAQVSKATVQRFGDGTVIVGALFSAIGGGVSVSLHGPTPEEIREAIEHVETRVATVDAEETLAAAAARRARS